MTERLVVIGGDAAGMSTATNARRGRSVDDLEVVVFERGDWISFSACGEPYYVAGIVDPLERLLVRSVEDFARGGITVRKQAEVLAIDAGSRTVTVRDRAQGRDEVVAYDSLMYATGASARRLPIEGSNLRGVHEMHTLDDARAVRAALDEAGADRVKRAVVVGGGYVGIEMAEAFHHRGIATTLISADPHLLGETLDAEFAEAFVEEVRALGITVVTEERVACIQGDEDGRVTAVGCGDQVYPADVVILATGTVPNVELARTAGLRIGESGGVWVDDHQRTSIPGIWAAGDCVETHHRLTDGPVNIHLGTYANRQGRIAGINIGGGDQAFPGVLATAISKVMSLEVARTGLTEAEATRAGFKAVATTFSSTTSAGYWPESTRMHVRAVADRPSRRILGAQIFGGPGAAKRIDALAMAIWNEMTVDDMVNADLSYAPPFSGVWDPVLVAARKLQELLG
jgi:NADPH-dependent 2,4-dienoyl-CoA reductase/sulfur reductase-like enzyme